MVRLKVSLRFLFSSKVRLFRFQNGSIKRKTSAIIHLQQNHRFDSKMVRLKGCSDFRNTQISGCFDSKMVRLKGSEHKRFVASDESFDSKMVRLKATSGS